LQNQTIISDDYSIIPCSEASILAVDEAQTFLLVAVLLEFFSREGQRKKVELY